jgi:hypothetical protein
MRQTPIVKLGAEFPAGTVVEINSDHIVLSTQQGNKPFTFPQIERFIDELRAISQA